MNVLGKRTLNRTSRLLFAGLLLGSGLFSVCDRQPITKYAENKPPETTIFIDSDRQLNATQSVRKIFWDGRDADGFIIGFYYTWEQNPEPTDWKFTQARSMEFALKITGVDTTYIFQVKAMDDDSLVDPTPAVQTFPIRNTAPVIKWTLDSRIPDTTYTVASFTWNASDLDGDSTIVAFEYVLDDTASGWHSIAGYNRILTLKADDGLSQGQHAFYIRAVDIAGSRSEIIRMPQDPTKFWYVREPVGRYLLVDDHNSETATFGLPDKYYKNMLTTLVGNYNYWNIEKLFPASVIQFKETLKLFDRIIWYTDLVKEDDDHFIAAQVAIPEVRQQGAKIMYICQFNTGFGAQGDPLAFTPVDSLKKYYDRIFPPAVFNGDTSSFKAVFPNAPDLPQLKVANAIFGTFAIKAKSGSVNLYRYNDVNQTPRPLFVVLGRNDNTGVYDFVFAGAPLHQLNGNNNLNQFFDAILNYVFQ